ncbi:small GTPase EhRabX15, putative [Entamoeba histolytica HM-3:IMSS]|uniref:Rab family GTPase n=4 Tax=Entamoeba histolytica TaxID=5759 RepID=A0A8U0WPE1_ENTH1|eukprot:XP_649287.1 Rab family GTPase [Entamoeba histolytica HM-1:IMSS]
MNFENDDYTLKICMVGDSCVGKTCIVNRFVTDTFDPYERETIGVNFISTMAPIKGQMLKVTIWDTAGQEKFRSMIDLYFRKAVGAFIVYDVMLRDSFQHLSYWIERVRNVEPNVKILIVGNKIDKQSKIISTKEAERFANDNHCQFIEVSALDGTNIKQMYQTMFDSLDPLVQNSPTVALENKQSNDKSGCC